MGNRALRTAASGMYAQQINIEVISNNMANMNTTAFKKNKAEFQDLMYQEVIVNTVTSSTPGNSNSGTGTVQVGNGVKPSTTQKSFLQGDITATSNPLDVAIQGLLALGDNLYGETPESGRPILGNPGFDDFGELHQGYLEASNVDVVEEMISMITAQRAYELNSKTVKTVEEMMTMANNLKR